MGNSIEGNFKELGPLECCEAIGALLGLEGGSRESIKFWILASIA